MDSRGAQARMLFQSETNELRVRIDDGCPQRERALETLRLDGLANGIRMDGQLTGDGADFPMFGVKIMKGATFVWECVDTDRRSFRFDRRCGNAAWLPADFPARAAALEALRRSMFPRPVHIQMMPGKRPKGNYDPSRGLVFAGIAPGNPAGCPYGRASRPGSVGAVCWLPAAVDAGIDRGTRRCNSGVRDRSASRCKTPCGTADRDKFDKGEPLRRVPTPYVAAGGTGQRGSFRDRLEQALFGLPDEGRRTWNPAASNGGVLFFTPYATILRSATWMIG